MSVNCTGPQSQGLTSDFLTWQQATKVLCAPAEVSSFLHPQARRDRRWRRAWQADHWPVRWALQAFKTALQTVSITPFPACLKMKVQQEDQASDLKISTGTFPRMLPFETI